MVDHKQTSGAINEDVISDALEHCAAEPVHIPGRVQPFGCLVAIDPTTQTILYASQNCDSIIGRGAAQLLNVSCTEALGPEVMHALNNAAFKKDFHVSIQSLGILTLPGGSVNARAFGSQGLWVMQFEQARRDAEGPETALPTLTYLMGRIQSCTDEATLFETTTQLLRRFSGYDRVMIYRFDNSFNGVVVAEARPKALEGFVGLRFPHWDIPPQARAMMSKIPLRFIEDVNQTSVPLLAANADLPPLDISLAETRGVSPVHMQYLRNMGAAATLTLSITSRDGLWGIISFHHSRPRIPSMQIREVLTAFLGLFVSKLEALQCDAQLSLIRRIDGIRDEVIDSIDDDTQPSKLVDLGATITSVMNASGVVIDTGGRRRAFGTTPAQTVLDRLAEDARARTDCVLTEDNLSGRYPDLKDDLNGCAGAIVTNQTSQKQNSDRMLFVFREETAKTVSWAGNPDKKIDLKDGSARLSPRASFSIYLDEVAGFCAPWSDEDIYFADRIWTLIKSSERRELRDTLQRQQKLMINELNHRVRNILAIVRSVSRQARRHNRSPESYSDAMERRIQALAASHNLISGTTFDAAELKELLALELTPFHTHDRIKINGPDVYIRSDTAPILSLVFHELVTNSAKYGALSVETGTLTVDIEAAETGAKLLWREQGGPVVKAPNTLGFGATLIKQAVPHEIGGTARLEFLSGGVEAEFVLPATAFDLDMASPPAKVVSLMTLNTRSDTPAFDPTVFTGTVIILEDNFVVATDLSDQLEDMGIETVITCATLQDGFDALAAEEVCCALLDINLGRSQTSETLAEALLERGIPFLFISGYGDSSILSDKLAAIPRLIKPLNPQMLKETLAEVMHPIAAPKGR